ncbi:MAG TPA: FAD-dependent oxidoreductase [Burkholderiales bacterium]|nr:FAD-dependent oxidoreductase [Burkholderiales bacterium]
MSRASRDIVVVGQGGAGLCAALAAAEAARQRSLPLRVTILEKAAEPDAGGNTRWTPAYMRMAAPDRVEPGFVRDVLDATGGRGDEAYFSRLAAEAPATLKWIVAQGVEFHQPPYYLAKGPSRIQPLGGGEAVHRALVRAASAAGVRFRHSCAAEELVLASGRIEGVRLAAGETVAADAVVLACGGFQANAATMREHFGAGGECIPLLASRARFNSGDGIAMARALGADISGDWNGMHIEPIDPRSRSSAPVMLLYPYGIVVDRAGRRFFDEGRGLVHETWEWLARHIHFSVDGRQAYAILDSRVLAIPDWQRATRSEVAPHRAGTLIELAQEIGVDPSGLIATVSAYNAACTADAGRFDATRCDGLKASAALLPPKSNWARAIAVPPFLAWPLVGAVAYTFGGLATDARARVLRGGAPFPGLYAAGEITGHFYGTAPNAVAVLRALVFGRRAGLEAVSFLVR